MEDKTKLAILRGEITTLMHVLEEFRDAPIVGSIARDQIAIYQRFLDILNS